MKKITKFIESLLPPAVTEFKRVELTIPPSGCVVCCFGLGNMDLASSQYSPKSVGRYVKFMSPEICIYSTREEAHGVISFVEATMTVNGGSPFGMVRLMLTENFEDLMISLGYKHGK